MDCQNQPKIVSIRQDSHGVLTCSKCSWPFLNQHPSFKQRQSHKKICGTIEGYITTINQNTHSDDENLQTASIKTMMRSYIESSSGFGDTSNKSEGESFEDAVLDFSDSGVSLGIEDTLESAKKSFGKLERKHAMPDSVVSDLNVISQPKDLRNISQIGNPEFIDSGLSTCSPRDHILNYSIESLNSDTIPGESSIGLHDNEASPNCVPFKPEIKENKELNISSFQDHIPTSLDGINSAKKTLKENINARTDGNVIQGHVVYSVLETDGKDINEIEEILPNKTENKSYDVYCCLSEKDSFEAEYFPLKDYISDTVEKVNLTREVDDQTAVTLVEDANVRNIDVENDHVLAVPDCISSKEDSLSLIENFKDLKSLNLLSVQLSDLDESSYSSFVDAPELGDDLKKGNEVSQANTSEINVAKSEFQEINPESSMVCMRSESGPRTSSKVLFVAEVGSNEFMVQGETKISVSSIKDHIGSFETVGNSVNEVEADEHFALNPEENQVHIITDLPRSDYIDVQDTTTEDVFAKYETAETQTLNDGSGNAIVESLVQTDSTYLDIVTDLSNKGTTNIDNLIVAHSSSLQNTGIEVHEDIKELPIIGNCEEMADKVCEVSKVVKSNQCVEVDLFQLSLESTKIKTTALYPLASELSDQSLYGIENTNNQGVEFGVSGANIKVSEQLLKISAVDIFVDTSSPIYNLEANAGSVSAVSQKSDVLPAVADIQALSSNDFRTHQSEEEKINANSVPFQNPHDVSILLKIAEAVDILVDSSSQTDCLEANVDLISVVSRISDVLPAGADSPALPSNDFRTLQDDEKKTNLNSTPFQNSHDANISKHLPEVSEAVDILVDSCSQTDSLEANWGSISVVSRQSDVPALLSNDFKTTPDEEKKDYHDKSCKNESMSDQKCESLEIPTIKNTNIHISDDSSEGKQKEIIAKVTNWSAGKQHVNLKSFLGNENLRESKYETTKNVNQDLSSLTAKVEMENEWDSPARNSEVIKREKRKMSGKCLLCCFPIN